MATGDLHSRLAALPGVLQCTVADDTVTLVVHPDVDPRLLKARAQVACAELGETRPLVVVGGLPAVVAGVPRSQPGGHRPVTTAARRATPLSIAVAGLLVVSAVALVPIDSRSPRPPEEPAPSVALAPPSSPRPVALAPPSASPSASPLLTSDAATVGSGEGGLDPTPSPAAPSGAPAAPGGALAMRRFSFPEGTAVLQGVASAGAAPLRIDVAAPAPSEHPPGSTTASPKPLAAVADGTAPATPIAADEAAVAGTPPAPSSLASAPETARTSALQPLASGTSTESATSPTTSTQSTVSGPSAETEISAETAASPPRRRGARGGVPARQSSIERSPSTTGGAKGEDPSGADEAERAEKPGRTAAPETGDGAGKAEAGGKGKAAELPTSAGSGSPHKGVDGNGRRSREN